MDSPHGKRVRSTMTGLHYDVTVRGETATLSAVAGEGQDGYKENLPADHLKAPRWVVVDVPSSPLEVAIKALESVQRLCEEPRVLAGQAEVVISLAILPEVRAALATIRAAAGPGEAPCRKVCKTCEGSGRVLEARWGGRVGTKQCPDCATPTPSTRPGTEPAR